MSTLNLGSWIKGKNNEMPPEKSESVQVCESLMMELDYQMQEAEQQAREKEREEKRKQSGVDYSWLATAQSKAYEMPELERLQLEQLCMKVKPIECSRVISMFRDSVLREPPFQEMPHLMRSVVLHVVDNRPKEDTMGEWMMKSLTKLKPASPRVVPITDPDDVEMQRSSSSSAVWTTRVQPSDRTDSGSVSISGDQTVDSLPV